jgi:hypothetical protein
VEIALYDISSLFSSSDERQFNADETSLTISISSDRDMRTVRMMGGEQDVKGVSVPFAYIQSIY